ncbi:MAG: hypothetical protein AAF192_07640 [Pseudomonadota bacterium]
MPARPLLRAILAAASLGLAALPAQALIVVDITGAPGSGITTWTFSGASEVAARNNFFDDDDGEIDGGWIVGPGFYLDQEESLSFLSSTATATIGADVFAIAAVGAANQDPQNDFGLALEDMDPGAQGVAFRVGDIVRLDGSAVAPVDITRFAPGVTDAAFYKRQTALPANPTQLAARFRVDVPLPGALPLLATGAALLGLGGLGRGARRRARPGLSGA